MKFVASLAILVTLVACSSAVTIPGVFLVDNIVNFCAFETYISQFTSKLSDAGKGYYKIAYQTWVQEMANQAGPIFANIIPTNQAEVATLLQYESMDVLAEFGRRIGYNQPTLVVPQGFNLCNYQNEMTKFVADNFKTTQGVNAMRIIFNQIFTNLIAKGPEIMAKVSEKMAPIYMSTVPVSDHQTFSQIALAYGLNV